MDQSNLINKDLAVKLCNSIELVYNSASEIKSVKEQDYEPLMEHFDIIGGFFKIKDKLGVLILCYLVNRRLVKGKSYITLNELMSAFECSLVDSISINEQLEYFRKNKILVSTKKTFGKKEDIEYALTQNTLNAVLKGDAEILNDKKEQSFTAFLNLFHSVVYDNELDDEDVSSELSVLMDEFDKLEEIKYLKGERLCPEELAIYLFVVARQSIFGDTKVSLERIFRVAVNDNFSKYDVIKASIGAKYEKYVPYLLTLFFFIWINNLLGLIPVFPGGANVTGNISVALVLAVLTFIITTVSGNKNYWQHIFAMPGVPKGVLILLTPIEILGMFLRPFVLMIRLFANIAAGHIIALSFFCLIFIFGQESLYGTGGGLGVSPLSLVFTVFMAMLELLVAFLQAYVFTLLSSVYIGAAVEEHHHDDHH